MTALHDLAHDLASIFLVVVAAIYSVLLWNRIHSLGVLRFLSGRLHNAKGEFLIDLLVLTAMLGFILGTIQGWLK